MEINARTVRTLSILGQRGALGTAMLEMAKADERIIAISADVGSPSGLDRLAAELPDQFLNAGIAEQNMLGVAAGMATNGQIPFAFTLANFAAMRAGEQVRHFMGYMKENVKLVGFGGGFAMGMFGNTHYGTEDIGAIRSIENLTIVAPSDGLSTVKAAQAAAAYDGPVYLRLTGVINTPILYKEDYDFTIGKSICLREGSDIAILAHGVVVANAVAAAEALDRDHGISASVIDMHTIKPIDTEQLAKLSNVGLVVTVEEHDVIGGLGSAVCEYYAASASHPKVLRIGVEGGYLPAGDYHFKVEQFGLDASSIAQRIAKEIK
jgi:transketolase